MNGLTKTICQNAFDAIMASDFPRPHILMLLLIWRMSFYRGSWDCLLRQTDFGGYGIHRTNVRPILADLQKLNIVKFNKLTKPESQLFGKGNIGNSKFFWAALNPDIETWDVPSQNVSDIQASIIHDVIKHQRYAMKHLKSSPKESISDLPEGSGPLRSKFLERSGPLPSKNLERSGPLRSGDNSSSTSTLQSTVEASESLTLDLDLEDVDSRVYEGVGGVIGGDRGLASENGPELKNEGTLQKATVLYRQEAIIFPHACSLIIARYNEMTGRRITLTADRKKWLAKLLVTGQPLFPVDDILVGIAGLLSHDWHIDEHAIELQLVIRKPDLVEKWRDYAHEKSLWCLTCWEKKESRQTTGGVVWRCPKGCDKKGKGDGNGISKRK